MIDPAVRKVWILPGFAAILVTVLLLWLAGTVADLLLLLSDLRDFEIVLGKT